MAPSSACIVPLRRGVALGRASSAMPRRAPPASRLASTESARAGRRRACRTRAAVRRPGRRRSTAPRQWPQGPRHPAAVSRTHTRPVGATGRVAACGVGGRHGGERGTVIPEWPQPRRCCAPGERGLVQRSGTILASEPAPRASAGFVGCRGMSRRCPGRSGGLPGGTRTPDLLLRRQLLYPVELRAGAAGRGGPAPVRLSRRAGGLNACGTGSRRTALRARARR